MSLNAKRMRITAITKELANDWNETKESWKDAKALEFENKYLQELLDSVDSSITVLDQLEKVLTKIKSDCE